MNPTPPPPSLIAPAPASSGPIPWGTPLPGAPPAPGVGWGQPPMVAGGQTRYGAERIRSSISLYRILVIIQLIAVVVGGTVAFLLAVPYTTGVGGIGVSSSSSSLVGTGAAVGALLALAAVLVLTILILTIISWLRWRDGIRRIAAESGAMGANQFQHAQAAKKFYSYTVWTFIIGILVAIVAAVVVAAIIIGQVSGSFHFNATNGSYSAPTAAQIRAAQQTLIGVIVGVALLGGIINFLLYYFASTSLREAISGVAPPEALARLESGRRNVILGAAFNLASILSFVVPLIGLISIAQPILLLLGFTALLEGYDRYLATRPGPMFAPPG
ncbi:MAG: hypothetical protein L3K15_09145 [Thermoplasmata archaeon]|nr:hypothetical protein [Thermoplasmata archaeon]